jgi:hypothetical protein
MTIFNHAVRGRPEAGPGEAADRMSALQAVRIGAYLHSARDLYRVEVVTGARALIEDCRNGELFDVAVTELLSLEPVQQDDAPK